MKIALSLASLVTILATAASASAPKVSCLVKQSQRGEPPRIVNIVLDSQIANRAKLAYASEAKLETILIRASQVSDLMGPSTRTLAIETATGVVLADAEVEFKTSRAGNSAPLLAISARIPWIEGRTTQIHCAFVQTEEAE